MLGIRTLGMRHLLAEAQWSFKCDLVGAHVGRTTTAVKQNKRLAALDGVSCVV